MAPTRRELLVWSAAALVPARPASATAPFRLGLTPVFLDNDAAVIAHLRDALSTAEGRPIEVVQRRTYQEIAGLLLEGAVEATWLCGFPYIQHIDDLALLGAPVWRGRPLYQSFLIASAEDPSMGLDDLRGDTHAFSDPTAIPGG
jgi:phosphonate transport system substrate-binding protein